MTDLPQAAIDAVDAEYTPWPPIGEWKAAARTDMNGPDARRAILLRGAEIAAPYIAAAERERIRQLAIETRAVRIKPCDHEPRCFYGGGHADPFADLLTEGTTP